jgi:putative colanic acid biosynthesis UDP-glucose lipid carrier transferase
MHSLKRACGTLPSQSNIFLKRLFDLILASLFSLLMFPAFLAMLLLLRILSPGPVFSRDPRADIQGNAFYILKFRVRHLDGRPFTFGQLLCRYSIDEWPQIFNVFKGEMSFVGPRPHWPEQNEAFARVLQNRYFRSEVKPGITGLAQICGFRGKPASDQEIARRLAADLEYIENWSFGLDCLILLKTGWPRRP